MDVKLFISVLLAIATFVGTRWWELRAARMRRLARQRDILTGLHAEIMAGGRASEFQTTPEERAYALENATPFQVADRTDFVFESVRKDISILPQSAVHEVVRYYRLAEQSNLMTEALQSSGFAEQSPDEKRKFIAQLLFLSDKQKRAAADTLQAIENALPYSTHRKLWEERMQKLSEPPLAEQFKQWAESVQP